MPGIPGPEWDRFEAFYPGQQIGTAVAALKQLKGIQRPTLAPGQSQTVQFTLTSRNLAHWVDPNGWTTSSGCYQIMVGDSSRNLPLTGNLTVP